MTSISREQDLRDRNVARLVDIVQGRVPAFDKAHLLFIQRALFSGGQEHREVEQFSDLERLVATAADCASGDRPGCAVEGAITIVIEHGRITAAMPIRDLPLRIAAERARPSGLRMIPTARNLLKGDQP